MNTGYLRHEVPKKLCGHRVGRFREFSNCVAIAFAAVIASVGLSGVSVAASLGSDVAWETSTVQQTLGGGEIVVPVVAKFRVTKSLANVTVFTVPEIRGFVTPQPSVFATLVPSTEYALQLTFSIPARAAEGVYEGTIHLRIGSQTIPQTLKVRITVNYRGNIPTSIATSLSPDSLQLITAVAPGASGLYFSQSNAELSALTPGVLLVLPPAASIPSGFLGKVTGSSHVGGSLLITTAAASLSDVFRRASVSFDRHLASQDLVSSIAMATGTSIHDHNSGVAPSDSSTAGGISARVTDLVVYDKDGNPATTADQILLDGSVTVDPVLHFGMDFSDFHLTHFVSTVQLNEDVDLTAKSRLEASVFDGAKEFAHYTWNPIVLWVSWIPVVVVPEVALVARAKGTASVGLQVRAQQASSLTAGVAFASGSWQTISDFSTSFSFDAPRFQAGGKIKGLVGPEFKLLLYGAIGPRADVDAFAEVDVDIFRTPIWQVFGGLEVNAGVHLQVLDHTIADQDFPLVIQLRRLLDEGGTASSGRLVGSVRDAITRLPLPDAVVVVYRDGNLIDSLQTDRAGGFSLPALVGAIYRFTVSRSGYLPVAYNGVSVLPGETKTLDVILQVDTAHSGPGNASGFVFNAISGAGVGGLSVSLRQGLNTVGGTVVVATTTGTTGAYAFGGLAAGNYTAEASGAGYTSTYFPVLCIGGASSGGQNGVISPIISAGQTRIVLTWGLVPSDLDSHLTGPLSGGGRFHMYYPYADANSGSPWPSVVHLDLDDTSSFGPETTTLLVQTSGLYRFSVHDYSNRSSTSSTALSSSGAQVRVYRGSDLVASFNVPLGQPGTLWTVFELEGVTIRPVNTIGYESTPSSILGVRRALETGGPLTQDLPAKQ